MPEPLTPLPDPTEPSTCAAKSVATLTVLDEGGRQTPAFDFLIERPVTMVGRCGELRLEDPLVSRRHVALIRDHEGTLLSDLGSPNPPLLNGAPVLRGATVRLREGDLVHLGQTTLVYHDPRPATPPTDSVLLGPAPGATPPFPLPPLSGVALVPVLAPPAPPAPPVIAPREPWPLLAPPTPAPAGPSAGVIMVALALLAGSAFAGSLLLSSAPPPRDVAPPTPRPAASTTIPGAPPPTPTEPPPAPIPTAAPAPVPAPSEWVEVELPLAPEPPQAAPSTPPTSPEPIEPKVLRAARLTCVRLLGRAPTSSEERSLGADPAAWAEWLLAQEALHLRWWQAEVVALGVGGTPPTGDASLDALRAAATSVAFTRRHGGEVPFADAVAGLLLGLHDGDPERQRVHDAARRVAAGWPQQALGVEARTPRDLLRAAVKDPRFARAALERALERVLDRSPTPEEVEAAETAFFLDPAAPGALLRAVVSRGLEG